MATLTIQELKLHILKLLGASQRAVHKFNLLGRPPMQGDLERALAVTFDSAQRTLADNAFEELKRAGLARPTYSDLIDPENWVEITPAGRRALEMGVLDDLDAALNAIDLHLLEIRRGAWSALASGQPDSLRQAAHSGRELIDQILKRAAPDPEVKSEPAFKPDPTSQSGITRGMRLRLIMKKYRGSVSDSDLAVAESACDLVLAADQRLTALAHARSVPSVEDVRDSLTAAEIALRRILLRISDASRPGT